MKLDKAKVRRFKSANKEDAAVSFDFFDANGKIATESNTYARVEIILSTGEVFVLSRAEFESLGSYAINVGMTKDQEN